MSYCEEINKPFNLSFNQIRNTVEVDRKIKTREERLEA